MKKILFTIVMISLTSVVYAQSPFTLVFEHDGIGTDSYAQVVDGIRTIIIPTCITTGTIRTCTSPITIVLNITHTVTVVAIGPFGESQSLPFMCVVPVAPVNPKVKKII